MNKQEEMRLIKHDFFHSIKEYLNIMNYDNHTYFTPTSVPKFYLPKSQKVEGWSEEEWFDSLVEKIYLQLNIKTGYQLHRVGDLDNYKSQEYILLLCSAFMYQIEGIIYNNCWITSLANSSMTIGSNTISSNDIYDDFWFPMPYQIFKSLGIIDDFGNYEIDIDNLDLSKMATIKYVDRQDQLMLEISTNFATELDRKTNSRITSEVETINTRVDNEVEELNEIILDKQMLMTYQKVNEDNEVVGDEIELGKVKRFQIRGIAQPEYDKTNEFAILDTLREIPSGTSATLSTTPIARPEGDEFAITAGWAYEHEKANEEAFENVKQQILDYPIEEKWEEQFKAYEFEIDFDNGGTSTRSLRMEAPKEPDFIAPSVDLKEGERDPLAMFNAISNKGRIADTIARNYDMTIEMKRIVEDHNKIIEYLKSQGQYLEYNANQLAKEKEDNGNKD